MHEQPTAKLAKTETAAAQDGSRDFPDAPTVDTPSVRQHDMDTTDLTVSAQTNLAAQSQPSSAAMQQHAALDTVLPQNALSMLSQRLLEQSAVPPLPEQLQRALGGPASMFGPNDMPAPWQALVQQVKNVQQQPQPSLPSLSNLSGLGLSGFAPSNLMATTLDAMLHMGSTAHSLSSFSQAMQPLPTTSLSRLAASSLGGSGDGAPPPPLADGPRLGRLHLKEERLIVQAIGICRASGRLSIPDALTKAHALMSKTGHLPPDTVIPPAWTDAQGAPGGEAAVCRGRWWTPCIECQQAAHPEVVGPRASRKSRYRGVEWDRSVGKWRARITHQGTHVVRSDSGCTRPQYRQEAQSG